MKYVRTTISLTEDLKRRMSDVEEVVNWSAIACRAFEEKLVEITAKKQESMDAKTPYRISFELVLSTNTYGEDLIRIRVLESVPNDQDPVQYLQHRVLREFGRKFSIGDFSPTKISEQHDVQVSKSLSIVEEEVAR